MAAHDDFQPVQHRAIITVCTMGATLMQALDQTIANVALPYMQGSLSASARRDHLGADLLHHRRGDHDRAGRLAGGAVRPQAAVHRLPGRASPSPRCCAARRSRCRRWCCSACCRACSAPPWCRCRRRRCWTSTRWSSAAQAMAIWGIGVMVGPILGPTLGGYLTEIYNWRYVFYINLPFGILAIARAAAVHAARAAAAQPALRLDRLRRAGDGHRRAAADARPRPGPGLVHLRARSSSRRCWRASGIYLFVVHMFTANEPFIPPGIFRDRNFSAGLAMMFADRHHPAVQLGADGAVAADPRRLPGGNGGPGDGAARHRHHGGDDDRRPLCSTRIDPRKLMAVRHPAAGAGRSGR